MLLSTLTKAASETNVWGISINVLVTGIVVVFAVLLLLILLIKLYSTIVYKAQNRAPKAPKNNGGNVAKSTVIDNGTAMALAQPQGLTDELIAVITAAAVACMGTSNIRVTGIRKRNQRSEWSDAGVRESVQPFRMGDWK